VLSGSTRLVGIIGDPVAHSLSPRMQNAAFEAVGLDWVYVPLPVRAERLGAAIRGLTALGFAGANVTIPHKTAVLPLCDDLDGVARRAASVNTLVVREGRVHGSSTDGLGVTGAVEVEGARVLVLGAGGAAQAVAVAAAEAGAASVTVAARRPEQAETLARLVGSRGRTGGWPPPVAEADVLVNATPLKGELVAIPLGHEVVVDLAYLPDGRETALVAAARAAGCPTVVDGLEVLVRQGAASFERWTGIPAPVEVMRRAVRSG
jgi:shikimate dehydrogenase